MPGALRRNCVADTRLSVVAPPATPDDGLPHTGRPYLSDAQGPCTYSYDHAFLVFTHLNGDDLECVHLFVPVGGEFLPALRDSINRISGTHLNQRRLTLIQIDGPRSEERRVGRDRRTQLDSRQ